MAKLIERKTYSLVLNQEELNVLYHMMIDSSYISDELICNIAETIVDSVDNIEPEEEIDIPF